MGILPGKKAVGCKWVFKIKRDRSGEFTKFKARLLVKGLTQSYEIDYDIIPVARKEFINTVLAIAAAEDLEAESLDVDTVGSGDVTADIPFRVDAPAARFGSFMWVIRVVTLSFDRLLVFERRIEKYLTSRLINH